LRMIFRHDGGDIKARVDAKRLPNFQESRPGRVTSVDYTIDKQRQLATGHPDFLFPFLFFRAPPTVLLSTNSTTFRARFVCRSSSCTGAADTACATAAGFASGSCSPDGLVSTLSLPSAGSTAEVPGITNFGSENTARYVLRVSGNSPRDCQQVARSEKRRNAHAHEGQVIWVW
jgi:hypothetical protein